jgi:hypothetical protein
MHHDEFFCAATSAAMQKTATLRGARTAVRAEADVVGYGSASRHLAHGPDHVHSDTRAVPHANTRLITIRDGSLFS